MIEHLSTEEALRQSEKRLNISLKAGKVGAWELDIATRETWRNEQFDLILGHETPLPNFTYNMFLDIVVADDRTEVDRKFQSALSSASDWDFECRIRRKDGAVRWVWGQGKPDYDGQNKKMMGVLQDITERKIMESKIKEDEAKLRSIFTSMDDCLVITDEKLNVIDINDSVLRLLGDTREEVIGHNALDTLEKSELDRAMKSLSNRMIKCLALERFDSKVKTKDGRSIDVDINISNLNDASGKLMGFVCVIRDITERKKIEEVLRASEERYRILADNISDVVWTMDLNYRYTYVSPSVELMRGFTPEEFKGVPLADYVTKEAYEVYVKNLIRELELEKAGGADPGRVTKQDLELKRKDGSWLWAEARITFLRDKTGKATGIMGITRDISDRKKMEEAIRANEKLLSAVFESMHDGIIVNDKDVKFMRWNQAALDISGFTAEEMLGKPGIELVIPEDRPKVIEELTKQFLGTATEIQSYRVKLPNGVMKHVELSVSALKDDAGNITGFVSAVRDVTKRIGMERELKKALDDLQRSNKELEQFAYIASHDLQEPLRMISSYTQLLSKRYTGKLDTSADEFIAYAVDGADRMQKMINDLLTFSRVTTRGKEFAAVDLEKSFTDALDNLKLSIEDNKATITHDPLPKVLADESQMVRLFQNLIGNALKFHGAEPPIIHIGCKDGEFDYTFSIKDNGIGIDKQYFNRLFVIFQRLHTRDQYPGTGIGLAVCKRTVERHGGNIWVESEGAGKGSIFLFTIPKRDLSKKAGTPEVLQEKDNVIKKEQK